MFSIKNAGPDDIDVISGLAHKTWTVAYRDILSADQLAYMLELIYSTESLQHQITVLGHNFILLIRDALPAGFASYSLKKPGGNIFRLHKIYVLPDTQGTGAGRFLLVNIVRKIIEENQLAIALELNVNRNNPAKHFYEKAGFVTIGEENIDIGQGYFMNDYIMRLDRDKFSSIYTS